MKLGTHESWGIPTVSSTGSELMTFELSVMCSAFKKTNTFNPVWWFFLHQDIRSVSSMFGRFHAGVLWSVQGSHLRQVTLGVLQATRIGLPMYWVADRYVFLIITYIILKLAYPFNVAAIESYTHTFYEGIIKALPIGIIHVEPCFLDDKFYKYKKCSHHMIGS